MRHVEAECLGRLEVDHQLELGWRLYRKVAGILAFEDAIDVTCGASVIFQSVRLTPLDASARQRPLLFSNARIVVVAFSGRGHCSHTDHHHCFPVRLSVGGPAECQDELVLPQSNPAWC